MKKYILPLISLILLTSNVITYLYFSSLNSELRSQSSFTVFAESDALPNGSAQLLECLKRAGIENRMENGNVMVREVDGRSAVKNCS